MIKLTLLLVRMAVLIFVVPAILGFVAGPARADRAAGPVTREANNYRGRY